MSIAPPQPASSSSSLVYSNRIITTHLNLSVRVLKAVITLILRLPPRTALTIRHLDATLLKGAELKVPLVPLAAEADAGMEHGKRDAGDDDHGALEDHECDFVVCELAVEALGQLGSAEDGTHEDGDGSDGEAWVVLARHSRGVVMDETYR